MTQVQTQPAAGPDTTSPILNIVGEKVVACLASDYSGPLHSIVERPLG